MKINSKIGLSGQFRFIIQKGIDENGKILQYEELFDENNNPIGDVITDKSYKNKILKRGLSFIIQTLLQGHTADSTGYDYGSHDIDSGTISNNPFKAICLVSDDSGYSGDAMVTFDESDGQYNTKIAPGSSSVGKGRRGVLLATTTGVNLKVVSITYPGVIFDVYYNYVSGSVTQIEYIIFAQANTVANETGDGGIDNFPIKSIGMANTVSCGNGEAGSQWGSRSVLGLRPNFQGICDRSYQHEGTGLTYYTGTTTITADGYVASSQLAGFGAENVFDGYSQEEGLSGVVDLGTGNWTSADSAGSHEIGRIWSSTKNIRGIRIIIPSETNKNFTPDKFKIRYLDPTANSNNPRPGTDADWVDVSDQDYTSSSQSTNIFDGGTYGYEYVFSSAVSCNGIKISSMVAFDSSHSVKIMELMAFELMSSITLSSDTLKLAVDGIPTYKTFNLTDVSATTDVEDIVDSINSVVDGYGLEAQRSNFGYLWLYGTVAGDNSKLDLDSVTNGSSANTKLGLWIAGGQKVGTTQELTKLPQDALTIIYRIELTKRS